VNTARVELFRKKHIQQSKVIDLSLLPPCLASLELHIHMANYVAVIWKCSLIPAAEYPEFSTDKIMQERLNGSKTNLSPKIKTCF